MPIIITLLALDLGAKRPGMAILLANPTVNIVTIADVLFIPPKSKVIVIEVEGCCTSAETADAFADS